MSDIDRYCRKCGGLITYNTDDEGRLIKWCSCCGTYYIIKDNVNTQDELTTAINQHKQSLFYLHNVDHMYSIPQQQTLEIKCGSIILKQNDISICFYSNKDIKQFDSIIINGIKFKKVEE